MKLMTATAAAFFVAAVALFTVNISAQDFNPLEKTFLTFSAPVELPGMTLPAGSYTFKLADTPGRNVVQVLSRDEKTVHGQLLFVQAKRRDVTGETVVMFKETAEGTTPALQYWFYPGEDIGKEFIYPKEQALRIAARTHSTVLSSDGERVSAADDSGNAAAVVEPEAPAAVAGGGSAGQAVAPAPEPVAPAPPAPAFQNQAAASSVNQSVAEPRTELPRTASPMPLITLLGMLSMAGGLGLRAFRS